MVKIKQKKQLNLPQLIEWAMDNDVTDRMFLTENSYCVGFDRHGFIYFNSSRTMPLYQTFTVEVEEEITEDTKLEKVVEVYGDDDFVWRATDWKETSVKGILATNQDNTRTETIHLINDDGTHTLIWRDGKLVE